MSRFPTIAREGALNNLSPALGAGETDVAEVGGRGGGHHKVLTRYASDARLVTAARNGSMRTPAATEEDRAVEVVPAIEPTVPWRVRKVRVVDHGVLSVLFIDGTEGNVDMRQLLDSDRVLGTVFEQLRDASFFSHVAVHLGVIEWPGEIDLAPDAMYDEIRAQGAWILS